MVDDGVLTVIPVEGGTTLRLRPAGDGSARRLRPLDRATRTVLDEYGCCPGPIEHRMLEEARARHRCDVAG
ncbi:hypothetical protein [Streptomyces sp. NPDC001851]|uniref:hypothetical protein n=1 Tax=Streptomyces sp. NPDC001851 TaxID=3154529 RepID=UPI00332DC437